jgi:hypothetical protein
MVIIRIDESATIVCAYAIASLGFGLVERIVGVLYYCKGVVAVYGEDRQSNAYRQLPLGQVVLILKLSR